jgi:hypothetical protein
MDFKGWHSGGYLPHFDSQDVTRFVTLRLADSLPLAALDRLRTADRAETLRDEMLDLGWGACWLREREIAGVLRTLFWRLTANAIACTHGRSCPITSMFCFLKPQPRRWVRTVACGAAAPFGRRTIGTASSEMTALQRRKTGLGEAPA